MQELTGRLESAELCEVDVEGLHGRAGEADLLRAESSPVRLLGASSRFPPSGGITDGLTHCLDPTVDLSGLPLDIEVTSVRIESVTLRLAVAGEVTTPESHLR